MSKDTKKSSYGLKPVSDDYSYNPTKYFRTNDGSRKYYYGLLNTKFEERYGFSPKTNSIIEAWEIYNKG